tara:strand:- start:1304 stop:1708 length:405 start_codon:yes stop_codon:yes gene_type:complete
MKVLIVDDDKLHLHFLKSVLENDGFEVKELDKATDIIDHIGSFKPSIVILDLVMPNKDGAIVAQELLNNITTRDIPIVILSASNSLLDKFKCYSLGCVDFIEKPFKSSDFIKTIRKYSRIGDVYHAFNDYSVSP